MTIIPLALLSLVSSSLRAHSVLNPARALRLDRSATLCVFGVGKQSELRSEEAPCERGCGVGGSKLRNAGHENFAQNPPPAAREIARRHTQTHTNPPNTSLRELL